MLIHQVNHLDVHNTEAFMQALSELEQSKRVLLLAQDRRGTLFIVLNVG